MKLYIYALLGLISGCILSADALSCYQCGRGGMPRCENDANSANLQQCPASANNYCIFANSTINFAFNTVLRYCSSQQISDCRDVTTPPGLVISDTCVAYACNSDGCNGSTMVKLSGIIFPLSIFLPLTLLSISF